MEETSSFIRGYLSVPDEVRGEPGGRIVRAHRADQAADAGLARP
jgi:hypothetical protein